jgi:5'-deoxynucleotidase YfbR-like HD superfamily hydrolase
MIALFIAEEIDIASRFESGEFSIAKVVRQALTHDIEEAVISDIPHDVKKHIDMGDALPELFEESLWDAPGWLEDAVLTPHGGTLEARIVKLADYVELMMYCKGEQRMGNTYLAGMCRTTIRLSTDLNMEIRSPTVTELIKECSG